MNIGHSNYKPSHSEELKIIRILFANVSGVKYCDCPSAKRGIISYNPSDHLPSCIYRKKILTGKYTVDIEVSPEKLRDGYNLGVPINDY